MLPKDAEQRRKQATAEKQCRIDSHLVDKPQKERVIPYSDNLFRSAAIEWLVSTDQVGPNFILNVTLLIPMDIAAHSIITTFIFPKHGPHRCACQYHNWH
jgi:hypothetical protein